MKTWPFIFIMLTITVTTLFMSNFFSDFVELSSPIDTQYVTDSINSMSTTLFGEKLSGRRLSEGEISLFGGMTSIKEMQGSLSIIIIVLAVYIVEKFFHGLHGMTHETPFQDMVLAIEKELMIVGCMAFIFKLIINSNNFLTHEWLFALEFADLVVPVTSFFFCIEGVLLILMSIKQCEIWSKAYHLKLIEIFDDYFDDSDIYRFLNQKVNFIPFSNVNAELEFRVFYSIFCDQYKIQKNAFHFDDYVQRMFEKFLLTIVTIRPVDWFLVCSLVLLNWARRALHLDFSKCDEPETTTSSSTHSFWGYRSLSGSASTDDHHLILEYNKCLAEANIEMFTFFGAVMFIFVISLAIASRFYELKVMSTRGITSGADYVPYLQYAEDQISPQIEHMRLNENALKQAVSEAKAKSSLNHEEEEEFEFIYRWLLTIYDLLTCQKAPESPNKIAHRIHPDNNNFHGLQEHAHSNDSNNNNTRKSVDKGRIGSRKKTKDRCDEESESIINSIQNKAQAKYIASLTTNNINNNNINNNINNNNINNNNINNNNNGDIHDIENAVIENKVMVKPGSPKSVNSNDINNNNNNINNNNDNSYDDYNTNGKQSHYEQKFHRTHDFLTKSGRSVNLKTSDWDPTKAILENKDSEELAEIFLFKNSKLYFDFVETLIMVVAFYVALWITNFWSSADQQLTSPKWVALSLLPGLFSMMIYIYIVKCAALLKALVHLDHDCVEETIEESEASRMLGQIVQAKMLSRLEAMGEPESQLLILFKEIDDNGSNLLSRREFQIFLEAMGITFSRKRWNQIFREIDKNYDDEISFEELFLFLFPNHDMALAEEKRRLKRIKKRVNQNINDIARRQTIFQTASNLVSDPHLFDASHGGLVVRNRMDSYSDDDVNKTLHINNNNNNNNNDINNNNDGRSIHANNHHSFIKLHSHHSHDASDDIMRDIEMAHQHQLHETPEINNSANINNNINELAKINEECNENSESNNNNNNGDSVKLQINM